MPKRTFVAIMASMLSFSTVALAQTSWSVVDGEIDLRLSAAANEAGISVEYAKPSAGRAPASMVYVRSEDDGDEFNAGRLEAKTGWAIGTAAAKLTIARPALDVASGTLTDSSIMHLVDADSGQRLLEVRNVRALFNESARTMRLRGEDVVLTPEFAGALGVEELAGETVGVLDVSLDVDFAGGESEPEYDDVLGAEPRGTECGATDGPDVIVGGIVGSSGNTAANYPSQQINGEWVDCFSIGTTSCNIGTTPLSWNDNGGNTNHPVIGQNFFRLVNGRFEQLGQSWLKHGFFALQGNLCCTNCSPQNGEIALGVGCSDPYSATRNGGQGNGPKFQVNAHTGVHIHPVGNPIITGSASARLQIHVNELNEPGALYWVEAQYVTADDAAAGNQNNNASNRQVTVTTTGNDRTFTLMGNTNREMAALRQWKLNDAAVVETDVQIENEGLVLMAAKVTDLGDGTWHYEYAVQNLNSDRSIGSFSVPVAGSATITNVGFRDVEYHSGEPFDNTDWSVTIENNSITWATTPFETNANANALRWGTMYNFRFDADVPPAEDQGLVTMGLFKPGTPAAVTALTVVPQDAAVSIKIVGGSPELLATCATNTLTLDVDDGAEDYVAGTARMHFSANGIEGPFTEYELTAIADTLYEIDLPAVTCGQDVRYYFTAEGSGGTTTTLPSNALTGEEYITPGIGFEETASLINEDFENGMPAGWTASGLWNVTGQCPVTPMCAESGSNWAYYGLTGSCNYDTGGVHFGALQRVIDLPPSEDIQLTYCSTFQRHIFTNGDLPELRVNGDLVDSPSDGLLGTDPPTWTTRTVDLTAYSGQTVTLSFEFGNLVFAADNYLGWQIDDVHLTAFVVSCVGGCACGDMNADGETDGRDVPLFTEAVMQLSTSQSDLDGGDFNGDQVVDTSDVNAMVGALLNGCGG